MDVAEHYYYQSLWTLVGARVSSLKSSLKDMKSIIPEGVQWIKKAVSSFQLKSNSINLVDNIVSFGVIWHKIFVLNGTKKTK